MQIHSQLYFETIYCSSSQPGFEAQNLDKSFFNTAGWKSQKFPIYPIELILKFQDVAMSEMQFLVSPDLKPHKIQISSYTKPDELSEIDMRYVKFSPLGEIKFGSRDNNVKNEGKSDYYKIFEQQMKQDSTRELKSLYFGEIRHKISLLKLVIHKNDLLVN